MRSSVCVHVVWTELGGVASKMFCKLLSTVFIILLFTCHSVFCAQGVKAADPSGKSDPYCVVSLVGCPEPTFKTDICQATLNPTWNQSFTFPPSSLSPFKQTIGPFYSPSHTLPVTLTHIITHAHSHTHTLTCSQERMERCNSMVIY